MQKIILTGFVGKDPEKKTTMNGKVFRFFPLGVRIYKDKEISTAWYKINFWDNKCATIIHSVKKGSGVTIIGDLKFVTAFTTKKGELGVDLTVSADSLYFVPMRKPDTSPISSSIEDQIPLDIEMEKKDEDCLF